MKKRNIIIIISVIVVLVAVIAVLAVLNAGDVKEKKALEAKELISIKAEGQELASIGSDLINSLDVVDFSATKDTSETGPEEHYYTGVAIMDILSELDIDLQGYSSLVARAIDGYTVAFDIQEVMAEENIYIVFKEDGEFLGTKSQGGKGPYMVIVRNDPFSQRWCKYLIELEFMK
jgi:hypothetical protein